MNISIVASAYLPQRLDPADKNGRKGSTTSAPPQNKPVTGEYVELSSTSLKFAQMSEAVSKLPDVRIDLVEKIKERIKNNDYPVSKNLDKALGQLVAQGIV